eukprot:TRINITY_DN1733_c0_g3_i1.p1 TRINITY_DN1733_c0_g3~~TRINITY_DN1733_c0_g3_i1.p1  ORF type:complete len:479 (-),score=130.96 TRINITY_DN1733_c0_g3_i1:41-1447(-)
MRVLKQHPDLSCALLGFSAYLCAYFVKAGFFAASFASQPAVWGVDFKAAAIIAQFFGIAVAKLPAGLFLSQIPRSRHALAMAISLGGATASLALLPVLCGRAGSAPMLVFFLNGFCFSWVWGLLILFMEGRKTTEAIIAFVSSSFIMGSGAARAFAAELLAHGFSELVMPVLAALFGLCACLLFLVFLSHVPAPSVHDIASRNQRLPISRRDAADFFRVWWPGVLFLTLTHCLLSALRTYRDAFAKEIWAGVGSTIAPGDYVAIELPVALLTLVCIGAIHKIDDNRRAFFVLLCVMAVGILLIGGVTAMFEQGLVSPLSWFVVLGVGLYLAYIPAGAMLFDRLIACIGVSHTSVFLCMASDFVGMLVTVAVLCVSSPAAAAAAAASAGELSAFSTRFLSLCYVVSYVGLAFLFLAWSFFFLKLSALPTGGVKVASASDSAPSSPNPTSEMSVAASTPSAKKRNPFGAV